jgi:putative sigma-54 modulation protein
MAKQSAEQRFVPMQVSVRGKNGAVPEALKQYAEKKVGKLERYFRSVQSAKVEQSTERGGLHIVEICLEGDGVFLRSQERCNDVYAAIDNAVNKMERQAKRFKTRVRHGHQRPGAVKEAGAEKAAEAAVGADSSEADEPYRPRIARRKRFPMKPMSAEEAATQMELVDHDFFLFLNEETGETNVLYRRRDGDYGLIEPEQ